MSLECCNNDCPCPVPPNTGAYWEKNYNDECCACKADAVGCGRLTKGVLPHKVETPNTCDCECDPTKIETSDPNPDVCTDGRCEKCCKLKEDNTDENGNFTDPCTPPFKFYSGDCECACNGNFDCAAEDPSKPHLKTSISDPSVCECFCKYSAGFPYSTCEELDPGKPDLRESDCSCYCALEEEANPCPDLANPDILPNKCECGCILDAEACASQDPPLAFDPSTCSCFCDLTAEDCTGTTPSFDEDKCQCYCEYQSPYGECPPDKPMLNNNCECECAIKAEDCVGSAQSAYNADKCVCECPNDSSSCTEALPDFDPLLCECYCALAEQQAAYDSGKPASSPCDDGYVLDTDTCSCKNQYEMFSSLDVDLLP